MKIWVNTICYNEDKFIWFALMSVVEYVDKILVYDTGSTDDTVAIIQEIKKTYPQKIIFKEVGKVTKDEFTKVRQEMLEKSDCDWLMILDGDEIWPEDSLKKVLETMNENKTLNGIVVPMRVFLGDIYHYQEEKAGRYELLGKKGHLSLRFMNRKISGLHVNLPYGKEGFYDGNNIAVDQLKDIVYIDAPYFHATHLKRSSGKRENDKFKLELGIPFPKENSLPEVFFKDRFRLVADPTKKAGPSFLIPAGVLTLPRKIKRRIES